MAKPLPDLEGKYADLGCMFDRARVKTELQVDSSPETSTKVAKVATHSAASEAPSVGSHETEAAKPVAEETGAGKPVAEEPHKGKTVLLNGSLGPKTTTTLSTIAFPNVRC